MEQEPEKKLVGITLKISAEANELLNASSKKSKRTKRAEGTLRLEDHLFRYSSIAEFCEEKNISRLKNKELINE